MAKNGYTTLNLPTSLVDELKVWKMAYAASYGKVVSYAEMIRGMLDSLEDTEPGVVSEMDEIIKKHPELMERMANYQGDALGIDTALLDPSLFSVEAHPGMFLGSEGKRGGRLYCAPDDLDILIPTFDTALTLQIGEDAPRSGSFRETMLFPERLTPKLYKEHFPYAVFLNGDHACVRMQNTILQDGPKVLLIKDSFTNCTAPYLALCCAQVDLIDVRRYSESVAAYIARTRPDAVCVTMDSAIENKHFAFQ